MTDLVAIEAAKKRERQNDRMTMFESLDDPSLCPGFTSILFLCPGKVPVSDSRMERPDSGVFSSHLLFFFDSNFRGFGPFDIRDEEPDLLDLDALCVEVAANFVTCGVFFEISDTELKKTV